MQNHRATSAIVSIDGKAAELRDFFQGKYFPVNVNARAEATVAPERVDQLRARPLPHSAAQRPVFPVERHFYRRHGAGF